MLIPGAGSDGWYWHLVVPELVARGHAAIPVDLPSGDDAAGLAEYADAVEDAIGPGEHDDLVLVAQSMGAFTAPLVCDRRPVSLMVLVAAMVPAPGESPGEWWANTGFEDARRAAGAAEGWDPTDWDPATLFLHDVPPEVAAASGDHVT
ncbi:MAG TPA: alpha/beta fold hydrolase, partial [Acidimicrobiales bacterium]|nr:alpha/beta fold hydrolase [Acidimicrobiales bacterium]